MIHLVYILNWPAPEVLLTRWERIINNDDNNMICLVSYTCLIGFTLHTSSSSPTFKVIPSVTQTFLNYVSLDYINFVQVLPAVCRRKDNVSYTLDTSRGPRKIQNYNKQRCMCSGHLIIKREQKQHLILLLHCKIYIEQIIIEQHQADVNHKTSVVKLI